MGHIMPLVFTVIFRIPHFTLFCQSSVGAPGWLFPAEEQAVAAFHGVSFACPQVYRIFSCFGFLFEYQKRTALLRL